MCQVIAHHLKVILGISTLLNSLECMREEEGGRDGGNRGRDGGDRGRRGRRELGKKGMKGWREICRGGMKLQLQLKVGARRARAPPLFSRWGLSPTTF